MNASETALALKEALADIDAYLETMPLKTDDRTIGDAGTPFVKSLRILREQFEGRGEVIADLTQEFDAIAETIDSDGKEPLSETAQTITESLSEIGQIIEAVDNRCMAVDGPVTPTLQEMTQKEMSRIYELTQPKRGDTPEEKHALRYGYP